ncbi:MAG TPA: ABC transporter ATP-binding protein [Syntrophales bacterium]|nr:ABC transporter ATP-binding protein [Syntrophales bacterium]HPQ43046.1 ABC transporter ATP-binding protein [Syntrophales bacterium]
MIEIQGLTKTFIKNGTRIEVLKGIDCRIERGECLAILGASGTGKTTLLQILGALDHPTSGHVFFDGADIFAWDEPRRAEFRNKRIGFVFQSYHLLPEFTALENTIMPALIHGIPRRDAYRRGEIVLTEVGLGDRLAHKPGELSGGEQQRVAIARAILMNPDVILADEPTGNLDGETGARIQKLLLDLGKAENTTLIIVTHNRLLANDMSRTINLADGKIHDL